MRIKSEIWVKALLRRAAVAGSPGVIVRRGDADAGAIFVIITRLDGTADLYGPAPAGLSPADGDRLLQSMKQRASDADVAAVIEREQRIDGDLWVVEIESRDGAHYLDGWLLDP